MRRSHTDADTRAYGNADAYTDIYAYSDADAHAIRATRNAGNDNSNASGREPNRFLERG